MDKKTLPSIVANAKEEAIDDLFFNLKVLVEKCENNGFRLLTVDEFTAL